MQPDAKLRPGGRGLMCSKHGKPAYIVPRSARQAGPHKDKGAVVKCVDCEVVR